MTRHPEKIYSQTGRRQAFMLYETRGGYKEIRPASRQQTIGIRELTERFPRAAFGKTLVEDALGRLESFPAFSVMLLFVDDFDDVRKASGDEAAISLLIDTAVVADKAFRGGGGFWGMIEQDLFGAFFPEKTEDDCRDIAAGIQEIFFNARKSTLSAGITEYPLADYQRRDVLQNARKALHQTRLSGTGGIAVFNAVSLNISADRLFQEGNIHGAAEELKTALKMNPMDADIRNSLGVCYASLGALNSALREFNAAAGIRPKAIMPVHNIGLVYEMMGDPEKALVYLIEADRLIEAYRLIEADRRLADDDRGEGVYELPFQIGRIYLQEGLPEKAQPYLERAVNLNPASAAAHRKMGECLIARGDIDGAAAAFSKAVKQNPNDAASLSELGVLFYRKGENPEIALLFCRHSIDISPENGVFRQRLGKLCLALNRPEEAMAAFKTAGELGCDSRMYIDQIEKMEASSEQPSRNKDSA